MMNFCAHLPEMLDKMSKTRFFEGTDNKSGHPFFEGKAFAGGKGFCVMRLSLGSVCALLLLFGSASVQAQVQPQSQVSGGQKPVAAAPPQALPVSNDAPPVAAVSVANAPALATVDVPAKIPPAVPVADPLADFKRLTAQDVSKLPPSADAPVPTAGGFQQPVNGALPDIDYNLESAEDAAAAKEAELLQKAREQAFDSAINGLMPMSPEQIAALLEKYKTTRAASEKRIGGAPKPEIVVQTVSLEPGVLPPVIKLSPGNVTSVTMMDMTGEPWPVQNVSWGGNFEVISPGDGGHVIRVSPLGAVETGNMSVQLVGLKTPVTFTLETQLDVVQYRFDARIPEYGPLASPPIIDKGLDIQAGSDRAIGQILDGVPPTGTEKIRLSGVDARTSVYRSGGNIYLRTPLSLLSPGWSASAKSADGTTVYVVNNTPVFLLSDRGKMVRAVVEENRDEQP